MFQFLLPIFMIAASIGLYFGIIDPTYKDVQALQNRKQEFDNAVNNAKQLSDTRNQLVAKVNSFSADDISRLTKMLPDYVDNIRLIIEIDRIALKYGMTLRDVSVSGISSPGSAGATPVVVPGTVGGVTKDYDKVSMSFSVVSSYDVFKKFLQELEDNLRIIDIENVSFSVSQDPKSADVYQFSVSLNTYWLK